MYFLFLCENINCEQYSTIADFDEFFRFKLTKVSMYTKSLAALKKRLYANEFVRLGWLGLAVAERSAAAALAANKAEIPCAANPIIIYVID